MSEADKKFEELGFYKEELKGYIDYTNKETNKEISFMKDKKLIEVCRGVSSEYITMQELQAINEKCKKMKWIE